MSFKAALVNVAQPIKAFARNVHGSMTVENGQAGLNHVGAALSQWKGRYVQLLKSHSYFAVGNLIAANLAVFTIANKIANKIDSFTNENDKYRRPALYHTRKVVLATLVGSITVGFNVLFSSLTGFKLSKQVLAIVGIASALLRLNIKTIHQMGQILLSKMGEIVSKIKGSRSPTENVEPLPPVLIEMLAMYMTWPELTALTKIANNPVLLKQYFETENVKMLNEQEIIGLARLTTDAGFTQRYLASDGPMTMSWPELKELAVVNPLFNQAIQDPAFIKRYLESTFQRKNACEVKIEPNEFVDLINNLPTEMKPTKIAFPLIDSHASIIKDHEELERAWSGVIQNTIRQNKFESVRIRMLDYFPGDCINALAGEQLNHLDLLLQDSDANQFLFLIVNSPNLVSFKLSGGVSFLASLPGGDTVFLLSRLEKLKELEITFNHVDTRRLARLVSKLEKLKLNIPSIRIEDLKKIFFQPTNLIELHLDMGAINDSSVLQVAMQCPRLQKLSFGNDFGFGNTALTPASRKMFEFLPRLKVFNLAEIKGIDDDETILSIAQNCLEIEKLNLRSSKITDKSLEYLQRCKKLRKLDISYCDVSPAAVAKLVENLPDLEEIVFHNHNEERTEGIREQLKLFEERLKIRC
jgi:hypothetical protein